MPEFRPGDTVVVQVKVRKRAASASQAYEGIVIASAIAD